MYKIIMLLLLALFPFLASGQIPDTILYTTIKLTTFDKFDKRPEPSFKLNKFFMKNLHYPDVAREENISGKVYIQFTIDVTGKVTKLTIVSSPHQSLSAETIRFVGLMPAWSPAIADNKPIPVSLTMPVVFKLE